MPLSRFLVFLLVVGGVTGLLHVYLWLRLVRSPAWPAPWASLATGALAVLGTTIVVALAFNRALPRVVAVPLTLTSHVWLGAMFYLFVLLLLAEPVALFAGRSESVARRVAVCAAAGAAVICAVGAVAAARDPAVVRISVGIRRLHPSLAGFRIVQISDLHVTSASDREFIGEIVAQANSLEPDLVAITGDLVDGTVEHLAPAVEPLRGLRARHGTVFVTGNHEFYSGANAWCAHVATLGIRVLRNERMEIRRDGAALDVAGIDDPTAASLHRPPDLAAALASRDPASPVVLLAHQPNAVEEASAAGVDLQLSGHTHGGQLQPFGWIVRLFQPSIAGLSRHGATALYVSRGTGLWGPPMRVLAPSEVTCIELVPE